MQMRFWMVQLTVSSMRIWTNRAGSQRVAAPRFRLLCAMLGRINSLSASTFPDAGPSKTVN